jgi:hypothetical protein
MENNRLEEKNTLQKMLNEVKTTFIERESLNKMLFEVKTIDDVKKLTSDLRLILSCEKNTFTEIDKMLIPFITTDFSLESTDNTTSPYQMIINVLSQFDKHLDSRTKVEICKKIINISHINQPENLKIIKTTFDEELEKIEKNISNIEKFFFDLHMKGFDLSLNDQGKSFAQSTISNLIRDIVSDYAKKLNNINKVDCKNYESKCIQVKSKCDPVTNNKTNTEKEKDAKENKEEIEKYQNKRDEEGKATSDIKNVLDVIRIVANIDYLGIDDQSQLYNKKVSAIIDIASNCLNFYNRTRDLINQNNPSEQIVLDNEGYKKIVEVNANFV